MAIPNTTENVPAELPKTTVYLIPCSLAENRTETIPAYVLDAVKKCQVFFVENDRTARRFLKSIWREMVIDDYEWHVIHKVEAPATRELDQAIRAGKSVGILSEAGCPGIADPGQILVDIAQQRGVKVQPLVGPSSILLALMASGLNGQQFRFSGYLPIEAGQRRKAILKLDEIARTTHETQLFIETPFRNNSLLKDLLQHCNPQTKLCIAANLTDTNEWVVTKKIQEWQKAIPELHKMPVMFLIG